MVRRATVVGSIVFSSLMFLVCSAAGMMRASPAATASPIPGTPAATAPRTLGELSDRIAAAWVGVRSYRTTIVFVIGPELPTPGSGTAVAGGPLDADAEVIEEVVLPDRRHHITRVEGTAVFEAIVVAGRVWVHPGAASAGGGDEDAWLEIDLAGLDPTDPDEQVLIALAAPIRPPPVELPPTVRAQAVRPLGPVTVAGRTCETYAAVVEAPEWGGRIEMTIALGPDDLPCFVETREVGRITRITYDPYTPPLTIEPPRVVVPAAPPAPATPAAN